MSNEIRQFVIDSLTEMNYDTEGIDDDTTLGPAGADLESLALAELTVRVEDRFGVRFSEEEAEELAGMTVGEFCTAVAKRLALAPTSGD
jgi:acyl carrier protein